MSDTNSPKTQASCSRASRSWRRRSLIATIVLSVAFGFFIIMVDPVSPWPWWRAFIASFLAFVAVFAIAYLAAMLAFVHFRIEELQEELTRIEERRREEQQAELDRLRMEQEAELDRLRRRVAELEGRR